jgi:hypothetical protein
MRGPVAAMAALALLVGCGDAQPPANPALKDRFTYPQFQTEVYPVLLRDCGFPECHGAPERFFRVYGPGRSRLPSNRTGLVPEALDAPSGQELESSLQLSLSMIDANDPARSLLLVKPLAEEAGGTHHMGVDNFGRNVYRTAQDEGYLAIARWVYSPVPGTVPPTPPPAPPTTP